jgi:hypothetical protein
MKSKSSCFKKRYQKDGQTRCLFGVDVDQWATLIKYWEEQNTQIKTSQLTSARGAVTKLSKYGCGGKVVAKAKLVCVCLNLIFLPLKMCINC